MKKNKGFTLVELLAVLVILSIIALIITPIVTDLIKESREKAAKDAMEGLMESINVYYGREVMKTDGVFNKNTTLTAEFQSNGEAKPTSSVKNVTLNGNSNIDLKYDGYKVTGGTISIDRDGGVVATNIIINGYKCQASSGNTTTCVEV